MRKVIYSILVLFIPSFSFAANWVFVTATEGKESLYFIDMDSVQREGNSITFWEIENYARRGKSGDLSNKAQWTINCRTRERILRYTTYYDDLDGRGRVIHSGPSADKWSPITPDTVSDEKRKFLCR